MSKALEGYFASLKQVRLRIHELAIAGHVTEIAELHLDEDTASVTDLSDSEKALALAARELARAVDELPRERRPSGWNA
jgi:hypothetical protein